MVIITMNYLKFIVQKLNKNSKLLFFNTEMEEFMLMIMILTILAGIKKFVINTLSGVKIPKMDIKVFSTQKNV